MLDELLANVNSAINPQTWPNVLSALAGALSAFIAYRTVRSSERQSMSQADLQRQLATISFVTEPTRHLSALRLNAFGEKQTYLNGRQEEVAKLAKSAEVNADAEVLCFRMEPLYPPEPVSREHADRIATLNKALAHRGYIYGVEPHTSISNLFNRLEEISSGIELGVFDFDVLDRLYGGLVSLSYRQFSDWLVWLRRTLGHRFFDQFDILIVSAKATPSDTRVTVGIFAP